MTDEQTTHLAEQFKRYYRKRRTIASIAKTLQHLRLQADQAELSPDQRRQLANNFHEDLK